MNSRRYLLLVVFTTLAILGVCAMTEATVSANPCIGNVCCGYCNFDSDCAAQGLTNYCCVHQGQTCDGLYGDFYAGTCRLDIGGG